MLSGSYFKLARGSILSSKWRSLLTMLGVVIGVVSVVTIVSIGQGVKQQVTAQITERGADLITILPGERVKRGGDGQIISFNPLIGGSGISFSEADYKTVAELADIRPVVPFGSVVGVAKTATREYAGAEIIAATEGVPAVLNQKLAFGSFYKDDEPGANSAVIGARVAEQLFGENVPLGKSLTVRDREFIVRGIFEEFENQVSFVPGADYDNGIFIPYRAGQEMMGGTIRIDQILTRPTDPDTVDATVAIIGETLKRARAGQEDFVVLTQEENLALSAKLLDIVTSMIGAVAAISLVVGGIGIMNIMLVSVTERTKEIGIRKAVGATNRQILYQFLTEAAVLSLAGGFLGVVLALLANFLLRIFTDLQPVITWPVVGIACAAALGVGLFFGVAPALKAARKDPIEALRHEQ